MVHVIIRHKVSEFGQWKSSFDAAFMFRMSAGERTCHIYRDCSDPNNVTIIFEWDSADRAARFVASEQLKSEMQKAGVVGQAEISIVQEVVTMRKTAAD